MRFSLGVIVLILCVNPAFGQTVREFEAKYGKPMEVYSVSENIWMTPEFAADGQICRMRLFSKRTDGRTNYLSDKLPFEELVNFLNALVPVGQRGKKIPLNFGATATGGPATWTTYGYEKVTFTFVSSFTSQGFDNSSPLKKGEYTFSVAEGQAERGSESSAPAADDFNDRQREPAEMVTISWNSRKCVSTK
ncbi:MAG TPA: hypothetical protein VF791_10730 [Pyrinomonadaceae bacterium]